MKRMALTMLLTAARLLNAMISFDQANRASSCYHGVLIFYHIIDDKNSKISTELCLVKILSLGLKTGSTQSSPVKIQESMTGNFQYEIAFALDRAI